MRSLLRLLSRVTSSGLYIPQIDGLRFIAIISVLAFHINGELLKHKTEFFSGDAHLSAFNKTIETWHFGVQLFFLISGFVLGLPLIKSGGGLTGQKLRGYYYRRLTRIEPPLIINLLIFAGLLLLMGKGTGLLPHWLASNFYVHGVVFGGAPLPNFVTWSLEIEAQFYLLAPLLVVMLNWCGRGKNAVLCILILAIGALNLTHTWSFSWWWVSVIPHLPYFFAGFLLAGFYLRSSSFVMGVSYKFDVWALLSWGGVQTSLFWKTSLPAVLIPFLMCAACAFSLKGRVFSWLLSRKLITLVGGMCYTIYLYHPFIKSALRRFTFEFMIGDIYWINAVLHICVLTSLIVVISSVLFILFEKPFMDKDWPRKLRFFLKEKLGRSTNITKSGLDC